MNKIKKLNPAIVVVFVVSVTLLARRGFDWLTLCAVAASVASIAMALIGGGKDAA